MRARISQPLKEGPTCAHAATIREKRPRDPLIPELAAGVLIRSQKGPSVQRPPPGVANKRRLFAADTSSSHYSASQLRSDTLRQRKRRTLRAD
ncbi:hypothetical protein MTO96_011574 [Rhipicephalus appendiculatus]